MSIVTVIIGILAIIFGLYTSVLRRKQPGKLAKLEAMKTQFGAKAGNLVHLIAYTIVPLAAGMIFVLAGIQGIALF